MSDAVLRGASNRKEKGKRQRAVKTQKLHSQFDSLHCCILGWYLFFFSLQFRCSTWWKMVCACCLLHLHCCLCWCITNKTNGTKYKHNTNAFNRRVPGNVCVPCVMSKNHFHVRHVRQAVDFMKPASQPAAAAP